MMARILKKPHLEKNDAVSEALLFENLYDSHLSNQIIKSLTQFMTGALNFI